MQPDLELVACGSSAVDMPTFGEWERVVLTETYDQVDYVSIHRYYEEKDGDLASFLGSVVDMDRFIDSVVATADHVKAVLKSDKQIDLSFDEWNVWYQSRAESVLPSGDQWPVGPVLLEDHYTAADAVVVGNMLISLLRHTDRVAAASQAQLVNVIAPIMTEPGGRAWRQTTFHPFAQAAALARGQVLRVEPVSPTFATAQHGDVASIDAVATWDAGSGDLAVFLVNRNPIEPVTVEIDLAGFPGIHLVRATTLAGEDPYERNTADEPDRVRPRERDDLELTGGRLSVTCPAVSWSTVQLSVG